MIYNILHNIFSNLGDSLGDSLKDVLRTRTIFKKSPKSYKYGCIFLYTSIITVSQNIYISRLFFSDIFYSL